MFRKSRSIGVLLDVAPFEVNGKRAVDLVKKQLVEFVRTFDEEDVFYLYNPAEVDVLDNRGEQIHAIGNYDTDGYKLQDLQLALKQTYYVLANQDEDSNRTLCYITNRFGKKDSSALKKVCRIGQTLGLLEEPVDILVVALGDRCDEDLIMETLEHEDCHAVFMTVPNVDFLKQDIEEYFDELDEEFREQAWQ